jgi:hypothetical protein
VQRIRKKQLGHCVELDHGRPSRNPDRLAAAGYQQGVEFCDLLHVLVLIDVQKATMGDSSLDTISIT